MDMSSMGGMDTAGEGPFRPANERVARGLWYGIIGAIGLLTLSRMLRNLESRQRHIFQKHNPRIVASRPRGVWSQAYATVTATVRELSYPQPMYFTGRISKHFSPLPLGRWLVLVFYWITLLCFLWSDTILLPSSAMYAYKWEKVGFRAAWVSVSQVPFIYLLSCKFNPISILTGIAYERFNWLHRWAARTVFVTVIVHWSFFFREWALANFVTLEIKMMPMVKYGFGAWATIGWMVISGFGFFRSLSYEIFVAQHICAAATLLWLLHTHVPAYARYNVYTAIGFVGFDWSARIIWIMLRNTHVLDRVQAAAFGYRVRLEAIPGDVVRLTIDDTGFDWKAGQHCYILMPRLRPFELHPFTIANSSNFQREGKSSRMTMVIKSHSGFSKSLYKAAVCNASGNRTYRAILSGPWGSPPDLRHYETVVLIACSTGASFVIPILQDLVQKSGCVRQVHLHWIVRSEEHFSWFEHDLRVAVEAAYRGSLCLRVAVHVTQPPRGGDAQNTVGKTSIASGVSLLSDDSISESASSSSSGVSPSDELTALSLPNEKGNQRSSSSMLTKTGGRPSVETMVRPPVEAALGETAIVVCGGLSITAQTRTFVAALADERAVHKGSGAQGIFLFSETYGW